MATPLPADKRLELLDSLRGFALFGIMFVNMTWFSGFAVQTPEQLEALGTASVDAIVAYWVGVLVDGKFWSIFAILFGVGAAIQCRRLQDRTPEFRQVFFRRMIALILIGFLHAVFVWFGDIVSLYAVAGLSLLIFCRMSARATLIAGLTFALLPILHSAIWLAVYAATATGPGSDPGHGPGEMLIYFSDGSYGQSFLANWEFLKERWVRAIYEGRFFKLIGMFLIGWFIGKIDLFREPENFRRPLIILALFGIVSGTAMNIWLSSSMFAEVAFRPPSVESWVVQSIRTIAVPVLALGYMAAFILLGSIKSVASALWPFAIAGRMTLTNYIAQSAICLIVFYGCGFGFWGSMGITWSLAVIVLIFGIQVLFSFVWLHFFTQGPLEYIWRCMTYARILPLKRSRVDLN